MVENKPSSDTEMAGDHPPPLPPPSEKADDAISPPPDPSPVSPPPVAGAAPETPAPALDSGEQPPAVAVPVPVPVPDCRSFSQLLAGAMASPAGSPRTARPILALPVDAVRVPVVAVPCFLTPTGLLDSPTFTGHFAMTHQAVLATVTAQAQVQMQAAHPSPTAGSFPQPVLSAVSPVPLQQRPPQVCEDGEVERTPVTDQKPHSAQYIAKAKPDDGYNWRKYGQKQVKSSDSSRSYYRCTTVDCSAKKKVERCPDGRVLEVMYRGQHNHGPPLQTRCSRERVIRPCGPLGESGILELPSSEANESDPSMSKTDQNLVNETSEQQLFCSSDCEGDAGGIKTEEDLGDEPDPKRRLSESIVPYSVPPLKTYREPRIVVQAASDVGRVSDGYKWRKYGQKIVKGNPNPRSYYRCTHSGCPVRKHVERASDDAKAILITYEGKHNHDLPGPKNSCDQPASPRPVTGASALTSSEQRQSSDSMLEQKPSTELTAVVGVKLTGEKASELGDEKALESAQALLSIGCNPSAGEADGGQDTGVKNPLLSKNPAAVSVQNS